MGGAVMAWQAQSTSWPNPGVSAVRHVEVTTKVPQLGSGTSIEMPALIDELLQPGDHVVARSYGAAVAVIAVAKNTARQVIDDGESGTSDIAKDQS